MLNKNKDIFLALIPLLIIILIIGFFYFRLNTSFDKNELGGKEVAAKQISANYYDYSTNNLKLSSEKGKTVLFFATNWCSSCTQLDKELMKESEKLKEGITVLKIDFDKDINFKKKYNILTQHTLVQVDKYGNEIAKWVGGDLEDINQNVK